MPQLKENHQQSTIGFSTSHFSHHGKLLLYDLNNYYNNFLWLCCQFYMIISKGGVFRLNKINIKDYMNAIMCINSYQNLSCD